MTPELRRYFDAPEDRGVLVARVEAEGPAEQAGVHVGDVILSADGEPIARPHDLRRIVAGKDPGQSVALDVLRKGKPRVVEPVTEASPHPKLRALEEFASDARRDLERRLEALERRMRELEGALRDKDDPALDST